MKLEIGKTVILMFPSDVNDYMIVATREVPHETKITKEPLFPSEGFDYLVVSLCNSGNPKEATNFINVKKEHIIPLE